MAEAALQRLVALSASLPNATLRKEHKELVNQLAGELNVTLDLNEDQSNDAAEGVTAKKSPRSPREEVEVGNGPSSAREKFRKQEQQNNTSPSSGGSLRTARVKSIKPSSPQQGGSTGNSDCDISSQDIRNAYDQVRDDSSETNWLSMGYGSAKKNLDLYGSGQGGLEEFKASLKDDEVTYGYIRMIYGDSQRYKFVFIAYVPDGLSILTKSRANTHKPAITQYLKFLHTDIYATSLADIEEESIQAKLKAASGANYGTGGTAAAGSEDFGSIKDSARNFFQQTESKGNRQTIVYNKGRAGITEKYIKA